MMECVDGEYQNFKAKGGAYTRENFFGKYPELKEMVANMSDEDIWHLNRGGHDARKVFNAYQAAIRHTDQPTVILAKTVKGFGLGRTGGEAQNITHQQKKLDDAALREFRDRFNIPVSDADIASLPYFRPAENSEETRYLQGRRKSLGGYLPQRSDRAPPLRTPALEAFKPLLESSGEREISTTMAFVRLLGILLKDKEIGSHVVPIVPDEARTFGMEGMFRQIGIYSSMGQLYTPQDADQLLYYREDKDRGGHGLREPRCQHGAVLHLLLDVRFSAHRRLRVGGGRHAGSWLPAGRHGGPHDAGGRRPAAPGRSQPAGRDDDPELRRVRPGVCL
jgi:pyruvate dehydrogenase E1 component